MSARPISSCSAQMAQIISFLVIAGAGLFKVVGRAFAAAAPMELDADGAALAAPPLPDDVGSEDNSQGLDCFADPFASSDYFLYPFTGSDCFSDSFTDSDCFSGPQQGFGLLFRPGKIVIAAEGATPKTIIVVLILVKVAFVTRRQGPQPAFPFLGRPLPSKYESTSPVSSYSARARAIGPHKPHCLR